eukprot:TRINITY_DN11890_c0_g1_i2.p1 TRINITY_DN11890_c0_g1~~TRINITY_DN11890_c0_g1_i2.p1  ORF type:complete len:697 (-),score=115.86 TRINITY_DN11890_c0_g1_i2:17-2107(-)
MGSSGRDSPVTCEGKDRSPSRSPSRTDALSRERMSLPGVEGRFEAGISGPFRRSMVSRSSRLTRLNSAASAVSFQDMPSSSWGRKSSRHEDYHTRSSCERNSPRHEDHVDRRLTGKVPLSVLKGGGGSSSRLRRANQSRTFPEWSEEANQREILRACVQSQAFDFLSGFVIILYAGLLGLDTDNASRNGGRSAEFVVQAYLVFNFIFLVELVVRISILLGSFFKADDAFWNIFDFVMVVCSFIELAVYIFDQTAGQQVDHTLGMTVATKAIRLLRLLRTCRLFRCLRYINEFKRMVLAFQGSVTTLGWCMILTFAQLYIFSIILTQGATDYLFHVGMDDENSVDEPIQMSSGDKFRDYDTKGLKDAFGSLPRSIFSLYTTISSGRDWEEVLRPLMRVHWIYIVTFMVFITFSIFGLLNILTSVFVESTMKTAMHYKELLIQDAQAKKERAVLHFKSLFKQMDIHGTGEVSAAEMKFHFENSAECLGYLEACEITISEIDVLIRLIDRDDSGTIDIDEFCEGCLKLKGDAKSYDIHCMIYENIRFLSKWSAFTEKFVAKVNDLEKHFQAVDVSLKGQQRVMKQALVTLRSAPSDICDHPVKSSYPHVEGDGSPFLSRPASVCFCGPSCCGEVGTDDGEAVRAGSQSQGYHTSRDPHFLEDVVGKLLAVEQPIKAARRNDLSKVQVRCGSGSLAKLSL